ncbi:MAG: Gfo/Idh/MocA family oxidoreductase [Lentimicrobiaceae bacterium]|nr:Gfo/Idh/MocA family oxidoreductase [Lentimicrobiaceae bacterium]
MSNNNHERLKIAFLGGAMNSAVGRAHFTAINLDHRFELVAGCFSRNEQLNMETAKQYGVHNDRVHLSLTELVEKEKDDLNAIAILTPTDQHAEQVLLCINAGIPVICEKALATTSQDANDIRVALEKNSGFLAVIYNYLGYPMIRELKSIIGKGFIGKPLHIQIEMPQESYRRVTANDKPIIPQDWRLHDGMISKISLDLGVHLHILIRYLTGEIPQSVISLCSSSGNFPHVIDNVSCMIEYTGSMSCNMWFSKIAIGKKNGLKLGIYGEVGSAEWIQENPENLYMADNKGHRWILDRGSDELKISNQKRYSRFKAGHPSGFLEAFANYYDDIASSLSLYSENQTNYLNEECYGINEAIEGLSLMEAISRSSSTKKWERLPAP